MSPWPIRIGLFEGLPSLVKVTVFCALTVKAEPWYHIPPSGVAGQPMGVQVFSYFPQIANTGGAAQKWITWFDISPLGRCPDRADIAWPALLVLALEYE
jgi:hypothetical protein